MAALTDRVLSIDELRALQGRSNLRGGTRLATHLAMLFLAGWLVVISPIWALLPSVLLLGLVQAALFAPVHETMHQTAFASRRINAIVGWLAACPSLLNWHFYTAYHLAHHRHTQQAEDDPELMGPPVNSVRSYMMRIIGIPYWSLRLRIIADCWRGDLSAYPYVPTAAAPTIIRSLRAMTALVVALTLLSVALFGWAAPLLYWIVPQLLGQPALRAYLLTEHTGCSEDRNGLTNTRTTLTSAPVRLLMWDMSYHAEHHLFPSIPFHRLAAAHCLIRDKLKVLQPGYARWNFDYVRSLRSQ